MSTTMSVDEAETLGFPFSPLQRLPTPPSSFVGRERQVDEVRRLLASGRLVTLTGPGGCGKTRLALEVADRVRDQFDDGVAFASLAPLDDPAQVAWTVARAIGIRASSGRPSWESVALEIGAQKLLLLADNLEHLLDAAGLFATWLARCERLTILATSRERLRLQGEFVYPVPSLALPPRATGARRSSSPATGSPAKDAPATTPGDRAADSEAVRLFVERARAIEPRFSLTDSTEQAVAEICRRLDGLPLAIELAAARVHVLSPEAMLARLSGAASTSPLELLTGGPRDLPPRQQTLRRTIAWSYDLLSPDEQALFRGLSVFVGGFTLEQAEAVCGGAVPHSAPDRDPRPAPPNPRPSMLDPVSSLLERSLVQPVEGDAGELRFAMLVTIREFAAEQLAASGELDELRRRHATFYLELAEEAAPLLHGSHQARRLDLLESVHDDLRAAMAWCAEHDVRAALRLGAALWRFWQVRGHVPEGRPWLDRMIEADEAVPTSSPRPERARALNAAAFLAFMAGDYDRAAERHRESLRIRRELGDRDGVAESLNNLGLVLRCIGDHDAAEPLFEEALAASRALGNRAREANVLNNLARAAYYRGDYQAARALHERGLAVGREADDAWAVAICLGDLGDVHHAQGDTQGARALYEQSLAAWRVLGDLRGVAQCLEGFAGLIVEARPESAVPLYASAASVRDAIGEPCSPVRQAALDRTLGQARVALGRAAYNAAWTLGAAMSPERAVEYAHAEPAADDSADAHHPPDAESGDAPTNMPNPLTRREVEVARLAAEGGSNRQIAAALVVSERTVGSHLDHIYAKLGVSSRTALAAYMFRKGLERQG